MEDNNSEKNKDKNTQKNNSIIIENFQILQEQQNQNLNTSFVSNNNDLDQSHHYFNHFNENTFESVKSLKDRQKQIQNENYSINYFRNIQSSFSPIDHNNLKNTTLKIDSIQEIKIESSNNLSHKQQQQKYNKSQKNLSSTNNNNQNTDQSKVNFSSTNQNMEEFTSLKQVEQSKQKQLNLINQESTGDSKIGDYQEKEPIFEKQKSEENKNSNEKKNIINTQNNNNNDDENEDNNKIEKSQESIRINFQIDKEIDLESKNNGEESNAHKKIFNRMNSQFRTFGNGGNLNKSIKLKEAAKFIEEKDNQQQMFF